MITLKKIAENNMKIYTSKKLTEKSLDKYAIDENYKGKNTYVLKRKNEMKTGHLNGYEDCPDVTV